MVVEIITVCFSSPVTTGVPSSKAEGRSALLQMYVECVLLFLLEAEYTSQGNKG